MDRKVKGEGGEVTLYTGDMEGMPPVIIMGINGKSRNQDRHAITLTAQQARSIAKMLNAIADLSN